MDPGAMPTQRARHSRTQSASPNVHAMTAAKENSNKHKRSLICTLVVALFNLLYHILSAVLSCLTPPPVRKFFGAILATLISIPYKIYSAFDSLPLHLRAIIAAVVGLTAASEYDGPGCVPPPLELRNAFLGFIGAFLVIATVIIIGDFIATSVWPWDRIEEGVWAGFFERWMWGYGNENVDTSVASQVDGIGEAHPHQRHAHSSTGILYRARINDLISEASELDGSSASRVSSRIPPKTQGSLRTGRLGKRIPVTADQQ